MVGRAPRPLHLRSQRLPLTAHGNDRTASGIHPPARQTVRMVCLLKRFQPLASPPGIAILQFHRLCLTSVRFSLLYEIVTVQAIGRDGIRPLEGKALFIGDSGTLANGALETISPLSFIPLVPYPARFARHLPHAGKVDRAAVDRVLSYIVDLRRSSRSFSSRFPHPTSAPSGHLLP